MAKFFEDLNNGLTTDVAGDEFPADTGSLTGHPLTEARLSAIQAIFQFKITDRTPADVRAEFLLHNIKKRKADKKLFRLILEDVADEEILEMYEGMIEDNLNDTWTYDRFGLLEKCLLIAAISEMYVKPNTPRKVIINEFVNISKGFFKPEETSFFNGILDALASSIKPEDRIALLGEIKSEEEVVDVEAAESEVSVEVAEEAVADKA